MSELNWYFGPDSLFSSHGFFAREIRTKRKIGDKTILKDSGGEESGKFLYTNETLVQISVLEEDGNKFLQDQRYFPGLLLEFQAREQLLFCVAFQDTNKCVGNSEISDFGDVSPQ